MSASIGLDIGTTQTKTVAFTDEAREATSAYFRYPLIQGTQGMAEQNQELIFQGVYTIMREIVKQLPSDTTIQFISFSSVIHSLILLDEEKTPLSRVITWAGNRAVNEAEKLKYTTLSKKFHRQTGTPIHPMTPLNKVR